MLGQPVDGQQRVRKRGTSRPRCGPPLLTADVPMCSATTWPAQPFYTIPLETSKHPPAPRLECRCAASPPGPRAAAATTQTLLPSPHRHPVAGGSAGGSTGQERAWPHARRDTPPPRAPCGGGWDQERERDRQVWRWRVEWRRRQRREWVQPRRVHRTHRSHRAGLPVRLQGRLGQQGRS